MGISDTNKIQILNNKFSNEAEMILKIKHLQHMTDKQRKIILEMK